MKSFELDGGDLDCKVYSNCKNILSILYLNTTLNKLSIFGILFTINLYDFVLKTNYKI